MMIEKDQKTAGRHEKLEKIQNNMTLLRNFIPAGQIAVMSDLMRGEELDFFIDKIVELIDRIEGMPKVYEQEGNPPEEVTVYLHYFIGDFDWYITEKDLSEEQFQAFGYADMGSPEMGYISIVELIQTGVVEIDLHFKPTPLNEIKKQVSEKHSPTSSPRP